MTVRIVPAMKTRRRWPWLLAAFNTLCVIYLIVAAPDVSAWVFVAYAFLIGSTIRDVFLLTRSQPVVRK